MHDVLSNMNIRPVIVSEAAIISELAMRSKAHWGYTPEFIEACRAELSHTAEQFDGEMIFYAAELNGAILGFYALIPLENKSFELDALFVEPRYIDAGVGRVLMQHAIEQVHIRGGLTILIVSDPYAESFYQKAGAYRIGERPSGSIAGRFLPLMQIEVKPN